MTDNFLGEIRMFGFAYAPTGWALCNGTLLPIQQNAALNALFGKTYGGNGQTTFALPDLRGRTPINFGTRSVGYTPAIGTAVGSETVALTTTQIPLHTHQAYGSKSLGTVAKGNNTALQSCSMVATVAGPQLYASGSPALQPLHADTLLATGGSQAHPNMQSSAVVNYCIATSGLWPSRP